MSTTGMPNSANVSGFGGETAPLNGRVSQNELDLHALAEHFPGYEIVDPVTIALQPVTIAAPPAHSEPGVHRT